MPYSEVVMFSSLLQDKLYQDEYLAVVTEEEKEEISGKLSAASSWMDEEGYSASTKELKEKLSELKKLCKAMFFRVEERKKWPDRLAALDTMLNHSSFFLKWVVTLSEQIFMWHWIKPVASNPI